MQEGWGGLFEGKSARVQLQRDGTSTGKSRQREPLRFEKVWGNRTIGEAYWRLQLLHAVTA